MKLFQKILIIISANIFIICSTAIISAEEHNEQKLYLEAQSLMDSYTGDSSILGKAAKLLQKILDSNSNSALAYVGIGRLTYKAGYIKYSNYEKGSLEKAKIYFDKALSINPKCFDAYFYGAYPYIFEKNYQKAKEMANKAREIDPGSLKVDLLFAEIAEGEKNYKEIEDRVQVIISKTKDKKMLIDAYNLLLEVYKSQKKYDQAEECYLKIIELDPNPWALVNYSHFLNNQGEYDKAIEYAKKALSLMKFGMGYYELSRAYYKKGVDLYWEKNQRKQSREYFELAIQYDPTNANAYYGLGISYYFTGQLEKDISQLEKAEEVLVKAIELNPNHEQAKESLKSLRKLLDMVKH